MNWENSIFFKELKYTWELTINELNYNINQENFSEIKIEEDDTTDNLYLKSVLCFKQRENILQFQ